MLANCKGKIYRDITDSDQRRILFPPKTESNSGYSIQAVYFY